MRKTIFILMALVLIFGCTTRPPIKNPDITMESLPSEHYIEGLKPVKQDYLGCAPASLEMVFTFYGRSLTRQEIAKKIKGPAGTPRGFVEWYARKQGFKYHFVYDHTSKKRKIKYFLAQNYPLLAISPRHINVLIGYDDYKVISLGKGFQGKDLGTVTGAFFVLEPSLGEQKEMPYRWFGECLVVYPG